MCVCVRASLMCLKERERERGIESFASKCVCVTALVCMCVNGARSSVRACARAHGRPSSDDSRALLVCVRRCMLHSQCLGSTPTTSPRPAIHSFIPPLSFPSPTRTQMDSDTTKEGAEAKGVLMVEGVGVWRNKENEGEWAGGWTDGRVGGRQGERRWEG